MKRHLVLAGGLLAASMAISSSQGRRMDRAPAEGAKIPAVSATAKEGGGGIELNAPRRLTVLVFGSYT